MLQIIAARRDGIQAAPGEQGPDVGIATCKSLVELRRCLDAVDQGLRDRGTGLAGSMP